MPSDGSEHKLAVILHADVVGSTALVQRDERVAHDRIQDAFRRFSETIESYGGIAHEVRGDALLAEYNRASDAVSAALAFQAANTEHNNTLDGEIRPEVRIGISLGEVVIADGTLTGPDVVLAQRLEQLAEPGGVCISVEVQHALPGRLPFEYVNLGDQEVKGFDGPVRAYAVTLQPGEDIPAPGTRARVEKPAGAAIRRIVAAGIVAVVLVVAGVVAWLQPWKPDVEPASVERMAFALPDKPSIAVLPFDNMSGDPTQDYFSDGITESVIADLARISDLFVVARNSSFTYKGTPVKVQQVGRELGVRYVMEGSVQKSGERVRVTAQLVDTTSGEHVWANRYDRDISDIFLVQDDITQHIVATIGAIAGARGPTREAELRRVSQRPTTSFEAYDYFLRGVELKDRFTKEDNLAAREMLAKAVELDPNYARALSQLAFTHILAYLLGWTDTPEQTRDEVEAIARRALEANKDDPWAYWALTYVYMWNNDFERALSAYEAALSLNPNDADIMIEYGWAISFTGDAEKGIPWIAKAMRLNPRHPGWYETNLVIALFNAHQYAEAVSASKKAVQPVPSIYLYVAASHARLGQIDEARAAIGKALELAPDVTVTQQSKVRIYEQPKDAKHYLDALRMAGLPE